MSFFNPFRKNNRPQGVKLSELNQESASGENAGGNPPERREPSFGGASGEASVPPAFAPSDANPPAFTFAEPESEGPRVQPVPQPVPPESPKMPAAEAKKPAPWDPYGIETVKNEPVMGSEPTAAQEKPVEPVFQTPQPEPVPSVQPVQPVSTISSASAAPVAAPSPRETVEAPIPESDLAAQVRAAEAEASASPSSAQAPPSDEPVMRPVPRAQAAQQRREAPQKPRVPTDAEILARRRTKHRLVGAAAILMAVVVAAPFILDSDPPIDDSGMKNVRMEIPKETETSTAINTADAQKKPEKAEVNVSDTTMGSRGSTAQANLAREAQTKAAPPSAKKTPEASAPKKADAAPEKKAEPAKKPAPEAARKTQPKSAGITPPSGKGWYVQVLATGNEEAAERTVRKMALLGLPAYKTKEGGNLWKVRAGLYGTRNEAESAIGTIVLNGVAQKPYVSRQ
ncbi:MAG: SPOR domain-containing protein [Sutterella seckii]